MLLLLLALLYCTLLFVCHCFAIPERYVKLVILTNLFLVLIKLMTFILNIYRCLMKHLFNVKLFYMKMLHSHRNQVPTHANP